MKNSIELIQNSTGELPASLFTLGHQLPNNEGIFITDLTASLPMLPHRSVVLRPNYFTFLICRVGRAKLLSNDLPFSIEPGTIMICKPGQYLSWAWCEIRDFYMISFTETFLKTSAQADTFNQFPFLISDMFHPCIANSDLVVELDSICLELKKEFTSRTAYRTQLLGSLLVFMLLKVKNALGREYNLGYERDKGSQIVYTFKKNLENHIRDLVAGRTDVQLRVSDFAALQHVHENYLNAVIKAKTGKTAKTCIAEKIISEAQGLLLHSALSNKEISYRLGFVESSHFSAYFKKYTGTTPLTYRLNHMG